MRGRWYLANAETGKITTIVFGESWITYEDLDTTELHKKKDGFDAYEYGRHHLGYEQKTKNWGEAPKSISSETGKIKINIWGWNVGGGNAVYTTATEHDQKVLVVAGGAGEWVNEVGWRSKSDAEKYVNEKFSNLHYNSDTDDNDDYIKIQKWEKRLCFTKQEC